MVTIVCIDDRGSKILELNASYQAIEKGNCYLIPIERNNIKELHKNYRRKNLKACKNRFVKVGDTIW